jgi:Ca2+:H+ antiporter
MVGKGQGIDGQAQMVVLSRAVSIILMLLYVTYLFFTLRTHKSLFDEDPDMDEEEEAADADRDALRPVSAICWLAVCLVCVSFCTVALLSSIHRSSLKANTYFLGFIMFPFLGNLTDYVSACRVAWKDELDITIMVTIGSSMQIMVFTWPFLVLLSWFFDQSMTFSLDLFEAAVVFLGVFVSSGLVKNTRSNYYIGTMCIAL